ncbi:MAG TPA: hypothetical protein PLM71_05280 [Syntrophorhabdaceae bacterium]|nr:hypothetical protein [Syntrophorhabdaceae bacterium]
MDYRSKNIYTLQDYTYNKTMIKRHIYDRIDKFTNNYNVLIICSPWEVGKTTLVKEYIAGSPAKSKFETGDDIRIKEVFSSKKILEKFFSQAMNCWL